MPQNENEKIEEEVVENKSEDTTEVDAETQEDIVETKEDVINDIKAMEKAKLQEEKMELAKQRHEEKERLSQEKNRKKLELQAEKYKELQARAEKRAIEKSQGNEEKLFEAANKRRNKIVHNAKLSKKLRKKLPEIIRIETDEKNGLSQEQVNERIESGLNNYKTTGSSKTISQIIAGNIFTVFNCLIFVIAGWLISIKSIKDLTFLVIVLANIIIGIIQEIKAKNTIDKLSILSAPSCEVIRDGKKQDVALEELVLDDLLYLENGKQICSDSIVVSGSIEVNESLLTGEADAIVKHPGDVLYSGSFVVSGRCYARVDKVGNDNYIEQLTGQAKKYKKPNSEILTSLKRIILVMGIIVIITGVSLFYIQKFKNGMAYELAVRKTAGAMIGMIPSGLYLVTSSALMLGVIRLGKNNVLVQELYCIEMLARVDTLCLDKTGTITDGTMNVKNTIDYTMIGNLTTKDVVSALLNATNDNNLTNIALESKFGRAKRLKHSEVIPFSSQRKYSAVTFEDYGTFVIGAPEFVLKKNYNLVSKDVNRQAKEGLRVLVIAYTKNSIINGELPDVNLEPVSLILIEDNVRPDAINTINYFKSSGVDVKVISGDNPITVSKVAERAGIDNASNYISLDGLTDLEVVRAASKYTVFGRVSPSQKRLLVQTLQELGHKVAMTGDGVNDILALKEADCSIAIASGSEAARNVSHLVLLDSNFDSMPRVVAEGRRVISNVAKVSKLYLTKTIFSLLLAIEALIHGSYPISTNQLLMIDLLCIGIPSMALILEPNNEKAPTNFLATIIKSALPGAIVVLIQSTIVFALQDSMDMSSRVCSTIICVNATFTCMMVLFETCKPFHNNLRKILFGGVLTVFVFATLFLPSYFDFSPLTNMFVYYSKTEELVTWETKNIYISKGGYYTVNGKVLDGVYAKQTSTHTVRIDSNGQLIIDDVYTYYPPELPIISTTTDGYFAIGGTDTNISYDENKTYTVVVQEDGDVLLETSNESINTGYNILPSVTISNNYYYVNGNITTVRAEDSSVGKVHLEGYQVYVGNINLNYKLYGETGLLFGVYNEDIYIDVAKTSLSYTESSATISIDENCHYLIDGVDTGVIYTPEINYTESGYYVIDGYISNYKATGDGNTITQSLSEDGYLKINGKQTDIFIEHTITTGAQVSALPLNCFILLICLCLSSHPLIAMMKGFVPFMKKQTKKITDLINKI